jgi:hypothetical protein
MHAPEMLGCINLPRSVDSCVKKLTLDIIAKNVAVHPKFH